MTASRRRGLHETAQKTDAHARDEPGRPSSRVSSTGSVRRTGTGLCNATAVAGSRQFPVPV